MKYEGTKMMVEYFWEKEMWNNVKEEVELLPEGSDVSVLKEDQSKDLLLEIELLRKLEKTFIDNFLKNPSMKENALNHVRGLIKEDLQNNQFKKAQQVAKLLNRFNEIVEDEEE